MAWAWTKGNFKMSKKKLTSILSSVVAIALGVAMAMISNGHVKKAKSVHEQLAAGIREMSVMINDLAAAKNSGGAPEMLAYARQNKARATAAADKIRQSCDYFQKVRVPSALKDELKAVRAAIPEMRSFADSFEAIFGGVMTESEFNSAVMAMGTRAERLLASDGFAQAESNFIKELNRLKSRRRFVWLEVFDCSLPREVSQAV